MGKDESAKRDEGAVVADILAFLRELKGHNDREWFAGQKPRYQELKAAFEGLVNYLIGRITLWDEEVRGLEAKDCIYRIYRDVRFSPDKSPYKTHFGAYICGFRGRNSGRCGYYFHLESRARPSWRAGAIARACLAETHPEGYL